MSHASSGPACKVSGNNLPEMTSIEAECVLQNFAWIQTRRTESGPGTVRDAFSKSGSSTPIATSGSPAKPRGKGEKEDAALNWLVHGNREFVHIEKKSLYVSNIKGIEPTNKPVKLMNKSREQNHDSSGTQKSSDSDSFSGSQELVSYRFDLSISLSNVSLLRSVKKMSLRLHVRCSSKNASIVSLTV